MTSLFVTLPQDTSAAVDTLSEAYSSKWEATSGLEHSGTFMHMMASHDLIYVVMAVSLIIWFVLLFFMIRTDKKVGELEEELEQLNNEESV